MAGAYCAAFRWWFGLTNGEADLLERLYLARGDWLTVDAIMIATRARRSTVQWFVHRLRQALEAEAIDSSVDGYRLTEVGVGECRAVLWAMGEELSRAA